LGLVFPQFAAAVEKGQPHWPDMLAGANATQLFDGFEETKTGRASIVEARAFHRICGAYHL
jgi:hypothetical protein